MLGGADPQVDDESLIKALYLCEYLKEDDLDNWKKTGARESLRDYLVDNLMVSPAVIRAVKRAYKKEPLFMEYLSRKVKSEEDGPKFRSLLASYVAEQRRPFWKRIARVIFFWREQ
jgi:hypothetical protein